MASKKSFVKKEKGGMTGEQKRTINGILYALLVIGAIGALIGIVELYQYLATTVWAI